MDIKFLYILSNQSMEKKIEFKLISSSPLSPPNQTSPKNIFGHGMSFIASRVAKLPFLLIGVWIISLITVGLRSPLYNDYLYLIAGYLSIFRSNTGTSIKKGQLDA